MAAKTLNTEIKFTTRETTGTGVCRKLRVENEVPAVLYGEEFKEGLAGSVSVKAISPIVKNGHWETTVLQLDLGEGKVASALIRDIQRHPLTQKVLHIDFYKVVKGHKVKVEVPVELINTDIAKGVKDGGVIEFETRLVTIDVLPRLIPEKLEFDVKDLELGAEVFVKDLTFPEDTKVITDLDAMVLHIVQPKASEASEGEEETEVEVVAKGKATEEE